MAGNKKGHMPPAVAEAGRKTRFTTETARAANAKSREAHEHNKQLRSAAAALLSCTPEMGQEQLASLKRMGLNEKSPSVRMLIMAQLVNLSLKGDLGAIQMLASFAGEDAATLTNNTKFDLERQRIELERQKLASAQSAADDVPQIIDDVGDVDVE